MSSSEHHQPERSVPDGRTEPTPADSGRPVPVVGIGGGVGAVEAVLAFFSDLPPDTALAFALMLDLPAEQAHDLESRLRAATRMRVVAVEVPAAIEPGTVYLVPPERIVNLASDRIWLAEPLDERRRRVAVDLFFRSLAESHGPHAAAVVLSAADGQGGIGIRRVRERGGLAIAQDPLDALRADMPEAVIATGLIDWVLTPKEMGRRLLAYFEAEARVQLPRDLPDAPDTPAVPPQPGRSAGTMLPDEPLLGAVLSHVRAQTGMDFAHFRRATLLARLRRRMQINDVATLDDYLSLMKTQPGESAALSRDLLVSVTNFFRDADAFRALSARLPELFRGKSADEPLRAWSIACATGEEAYSLAILLLEHARTLPSPPGIQVFATDLDANALQVGRDGVFPDAIEADVSPQLLANYFVKERRGWRVRREVRELVLFARHDVLVDAPFSQLDLVACRNLLAYFDDTACQRVLENLRFALHPHGLLMLGLREHVPAGVTGFAGVDDRHRLYLREPGGSVFATTSGGSPATIGPRAASPVPIAAAAMVVPAAPLLPIAAMQYVPRPQAQSPAPGAGRRSLSWAEQHARLLEELAPPSMLVTTEHEVVHLSANAGRHLHFNAGAPTRDLLSLVPPEHRFALQAALYKAAESGQPAATDEFTTPDDGSPQGLVMRVVPVRRDADAMLLVLFEVPAPRPAADPPAPVPRTDAEPVAHELGRELERIKSHLRDTVQRYEFGTHELRSANEELRAINEELRSATEEFQFSREELQSLNEELTTVNQTLALKVEELARSNADMHNLMNASPIASVFLDLHLGITRYTPAAASLFNIIDADLGRPITDLTSQLQYGDLAADAKAVLDRLQPIEREVGRKDGSWFLARVQPYRSAEDRIAGVVLSFIDITQRKQAEELSLWLSSVVASSRDAIVSFTLDATVLSWNAGAERLFGWTAAEMVGQPMSVLIDPGQADEQDWLLAQVRRRRSLEGIDTVRRAKDGGLLQVAITASPVVGADGRILGGAISVRDVRDAKRAEAALRHSEERLRLVIENAREYAIFAMDTERRITSWNSGAEALLGFSEREVIGELGDIIFTPEDREAGAPLQEAATAERDGRAADERFHVRKDGSRFWGSGTLMRMHDASGGVIGFVKILRDHTQAREAQAALQRSRAELLQALQEKEAARASLEAADRAKNRFLAVLSHELRNPLASVLSAADLLARQDAGPQDKARSAQVVRRQSRTMKVLLDDLLDVSRLTVGRIEPHMRDVELAHVIDLALETVRPAIEAARHTLDLRLPQAPVSMQADPIRISQVLINLLANAAKYTPPGGRLALHAEADADEARLTVSDNGEGIDPGEIDRMFELYTQGPPVRHRLNQGLGIGLALVRSIVDLHHGSVSAASEGPGRGARFVVRLPLRQPGTAQGRSPDEATAPGPAITDAPAAGSLSILVADDNTDAAWALSRLLQKAGHRTLLADSGAEALAQVERHGPEVAILDIGMPDLNGMEVARRLRARPDGAKLVLIALTGWGGDANRRLILESGFDEHLTKPVDLPELQRTLAKLARRAPGE
ncbi:MAG: PAS domain S-box protein [Comamonadaceae bacterium]|nr:MAG: PAS domain S-box protein [Comamonadaceae bacterium]